MFVINVIFVVHIYTSTRYMRVNVYFNKRNENENTVISAQFFHIFSSYNLVFVYTRSTWAALNAMKRVGDLFRFWERESAAHTDGAMVFSKLFRIEFDREKARQKMVLGAKKPNRLL